MSRDLQPLIEEIALLDGIIEPLSDRPLDITGPEWLEPPPDRLVTAGIKTEAQNALRELVELYASGGDEARAIVRSVFSRYRYFRSAAYIDTEPTVEGFRFRLLHFSAVDQGADARDELLGLRDLCAATKQAGVDIDPVLAEVAELSSDEDKYGMGSTRDFLLWAMSG